MLSVSEASLMLLKVPKSWEKRVFGLTSPVGFTVVNHFTTLPFLAMGLIYST